MITTRRHVLGAIALALSTLALPLAAHDGLRPGMVFTSSNDAAGNELLVYARRADGGLTHGHACSTGGLGSGAGLGSQGAVTLSRDGRYVFVVNAQSNTRVDLRAGRAMRWHSCRPSTPAACTRSA